MDEAKARAKVMRFLKTIPHTVGKGRWVIRDDATEDHELFWLFCWTTSRALWPRRRAISMAGNVPLAVSKRDGKVYAWDLLCPLEGFTERLRRGELTPVFE
ncbi:MAG TPA: YrhB domain-containing protein [Gemmataceae bacterium]|nr:YrhB domain-containing protein [Gemmataceae bacterium]